MKIGTDNSDGRPGSLDQVGTVTTRHSTPVTRPTLPSTGDQLTVSDAARMLQAATDSAQSGPAVRHDVIERLRALMAEGRLDSDAVKLADAIIDTWIDQP